MKTSARSPARSSVGVLIMLTATGCLNLSPEGRLFACPECVDSGPISACDCPLPPAACNGSARVEAQTARCTITGDCRYSGVVTECPNGCTDGLCDGNKCLGVTCQNPPASTCVNATTLRHYQGPGSCFGGGCSYVPVEVSCACVDNKCTIDPCVGITCNTPPPAICAGAVRRSYDSGGMCDPADGFCHYLPNDTPCANGCVDAQCQQDLCAGVSCVSPPAPSCSTSNSMLTYAQTGICNSASGECMYTSMALACQSGEVCSNGKCMVPPPQCNDANCAGCCDGTQCVTTASQSNMRCGTRAAACAACGASTPQCKSGVCTSLCAGVVCGQAPAAVCMGSTLRTYATPGTCADTTGQCSYAPSDMICANGCSNGACNGSLCAGVTCNNPPAVSCFDTASRRVYSSPGICAAATGQCNYSWTQQACPPNSTCMAGVCQPNPPVGTIEQIASSDTHSCAVRSDKTIWCWGDNALGQLGDGTTTNQWVPKKVSGSNWVQTGVGFYHSCGLTDDGEIWCWGDNDDGQLGSNDTTAHHTPVRTTGSAWISLAVGGWQNCAIQDDHTLWCWGDNFYGQLGLGHKDQRNTPTKLTGNAWAQVAIGTRHMCAITTGGGLYCWGYNEWGMVGDGTTSESLTPTSVSISSWESVSLGARHSCATKTDHSLWCWGFNSDGQLGMGDTQQRTSPTALPGSAWQRVGAGLFHTCAVRTDGTLWCWGDNEFATIGDGTTTDRVAPKQIPGTTWKYPAPGEQHSCVTKTDGSAWCWGTPTHGEVGNNSTSTSTTPVRVSGT